MKTSPSGNRIGSAKSAVIAVLFASLSTPAQALHFENSYVSFDLPEGWTCILEQTEWVCKPKSNAEGKTAMIAILTAKEVGPGDSPQLYIRHLEDVGKQSGIVVDTAPKDKLIGRALWIDASLWNSEIPNYKTRYLARTEGAIGVLVTFSAHRSVAGGAEAISDAMARSVVLNSQFARPELH